MPTTYTECDSDVRDLVDSLLVLWHRDLREADVTIKLMFAENDTGDALKHGGYPALAIAKINNLKSRCEGLDDCSITIDKRWWDEHDDDESRKALLDHELEHFIICRDDQGRIKTDDANRPKLRMKKHDFSIGGFFVIAKRHKQNAVEVGQIFAVNREFRQLELWPNDDMRPDVGNDGVPEAAGVLS